VITIRAVDPATDSGVAGYSSALHDTPAAFSGITVSTDHWTIDGIRRDEDDWQDQTAYGITGSSSLVVGPEVDHLTVRYVALVGSGTTAAISQADQTGSAWRTNLTYHRCLMENWGFGLHSREASSVTIEWCHIGPTYSKEAIAHQFGHDWVIRYTRFIDTGQGTGEDTQTATIGVFNFTGGGDPADTDSDGWEIYGCVFASSGRATQAAMRCQDALMIGNEVNNWLFAHNTISRTGGAWGGRITMTGTGNVAVNNLWYWMGNYDAEWGSIVGTSPAANHSWCYYVNPLPARLGADCSALAGTVHTGSENPFHAEASGDYRIKATNFSGVSPIDKATALGAPYNQDAYGVTHANIGAYSTYEPRKGVINKGVIKGSPIRAGGHP
jgi:hypothetical protein